MGVTLDGRVAKTPQAASLRLPNRSLAALVAAEWSRQGERIDFAVMPLTRLAFTAIDRVADARRETAAEIARYGAHDVLCHLAEGPARLRALQTAAWNPWRLWAQTELGADLQAGSGLHGPRQPDESLGRIQALALEGDDFALAGLALAASLFGSAILAFALHKGALDADTALDLSRLDEAFQEAFWGVDAEAAARTAALRTEAGALQAWFDALCGRGSA